MGSRATRSVFAVALCSGVAMVGASVHGMLDVDTQLQRSVLAAQQNDDQQHSVRVILREGDGNCAAPHKPHPRV